jgi:hypothetical protein
MEANKDFVCDECKYTRAPHEHRCLDLENCTCSHCVEVKKFSKSIEAKDKTAEQIYFRHTGDSFGRMKMNTIVAAMEEYSNTQNASLKEELQRVYELVKKWHNQSDANEQCWKETVKDYNDLRERYKHLHEENERLKAACNMAAIEIEKGTADQLTVDALRSALSPSN